MLVLTPPCIYSVADQEFFKGGSSGDRSSTLAGANARTDVIPH